MSSDLWKFQNPVFAFYTLCSAVLMLKISFMPVLTGINRTIYKSFGWPEDNRFNGLKEDVKPTHPKVERTRRCHQNDLENILPFFSIGLLYIQTNPSITVARILFGGFTITRLAHTFFFMNAIPQPSRVISFIIGLTINFIMILSILKEVLPMVFL